MPKIYSEVDSHASSWRNRDEDIEMSIVQPSFRKRFTSATESNASEDTLSTDESDDETSEGCLDSLRNALGQCCSAENALTVLRLKWLACHTNKPTEKEFKEEPYEKRREVMHARFGHVDYQRMRTTNLLPDLEDFPEYRTIMDCDENELVRDYVIDKMECLDVSRMLGFFPNTQNLIFLGVPPSKICWSMPIDQERDQRWMSTRVKNIVFSFKDHYDNKFCMTFSHADRGAFTRYFISLVVNYWLYMNESAFSNLVTHPEFRYLTYVFNSGKNSHFRKLSQWMPNDEICPAIHSLIAQRLTWDNAFPTTHWGTLRLLSSEIHCNDFMKNWDLSPATNLEKVIIKIKGVHSINIENVKLKHFEVEGIDKKNNIVTVTMAQEYPHLEGLIIYCNDFKTKFQVTLPLLTRELKELALRKFVFYAPTEAVDGDDFSTFIESCTILEDCTLSLFEGIRNIPLSSIALQTLFISCDEKREDDTSAKRIVCSDLTLPQSIKRVELNDVGFEKITLPDIANDLDLIFLHNIVGLTTFEVTGNYPKLLGLVIDECQQLTKVTMSSSARSDFQGFFIDSKELQELHLYPNIEGDEARIHVDNLPQLHTLDESDDHAKRYILSQHKVPKLSRNSSMSEFIYTSWFVISCFFIDIMSCKRKNKSS